MEMLKNSINWFEIPVDDFDRAKLFYSMIYNYEMPEQMMGPVRMGFFLVEKGESAVQLCKAKDMCQVWKVHWSI